MHSRRTVRAGVEALEHRILFAAAILRHPTGEVLVTPPAAQAESHTVQIKRQSPEVTLPTGNVLPGQGLKTAETHTPVVNWTPT